MRFSVWIIPWSARCARFCLGLCIRYQIWLWHELKLPGNQLSGVTAGAGLARKVLHRGTDFTAFLSLHSPWPKITTALSQFIHSLPRFSSCCFFGFQGVKFHGVRAAHNLAALCWSTCLSSLPASHGESRRLLWVDDYFAVVSRATEEGPGHLPRHGPQQCPLPETLLLV